MLMNTMNTRTAHLNKFAKDPRWVGSNRTAGVWGIAPQNKHGLREGAKRRT